MMLVTMLMTITESGGQKDDTDVELHGAADEHGKGTMTTSQ